MLSDRKPQLVVEILVFSQPRRVVAGSSMTERLTFDTKFTPLCDQPHQQLSRYRTLLQIHSEARIALAYTPHTQDVSRTPRRAD